MEAEDLSRADVSVVGSYLRPAHSAAFPEEPADSPSRCESACSHRQEMTSHCPHKGAPLPPCLFLDRLFCLPSGFSLNQPLLAPPVNLKDSGTWLPSLRGESRSVPGSGGRRSIATSLHPRSSREAETRSRFAWASLIRHPERK